LVHPHSKWTQPRQFLGRDFVEAPVESLQML
jgi:hypothetical protein